MMKLRLKGKVVFIICSILLVALGINSIISILNFKKHYQQALYSKVTAIGQQIVSNIQDVMALGLTIRQLEGMNTLCTKTAKNYDTELGYVMVVDPQSKVLYHNNLDQIGQILNDPTDLLAASAKSITTQPYNIQKTSYTDIAIPVFNATEEHVGTVRLGLLNESINTKIRQLLIVSLFISMVSFVLAIILIIRFMDVNLILPIRQLVDMLDDIAKGQGNLTKKLSVHSNDEIGELAELFNKFIGTLHKMISQIHTVAEKVSSLSEALSSSAEEMNATTNEISGVIQSVSKGVTNQAIKTKHTSEIMDKISQSLKDISLNSEVANLASKEAAVIAQKGGESSRQAIASMDKINKVIVSLSNGVGRLIGRSKQISEIVDTLTAIADQTNLLALNAAIEAARAGEAGASFSVVATEVGKLAENSANSAKRIGKLLIEINKDTAESEKSMEENKKEVIEGTKVVKKLGDALDEIVGSAQKASQMVSQIASSTVDQSESTKKATKSITDISLIANESAASIEQASSSTQEQGASMEELAATAQELNRLSVSLKELVSKFKLN